jgi:uncharacterized protein YdcH (DUF465 family)
MSKHHARSISPDRQVSRLQKKHAELAERVEDLDSRLSLTPSEEMELQRLKKEKLWTKDAIQDARQ